MTTIHGIRSFAGVRDRAIRVELDDAAILVGSLADMQACREAAPRVLDILEKTLEESPEPARPSRRTRARK